MPIKPDDAHQLIRPLMDAAVCAGVKQSGMAGRIMRYGSRVFGGFTWRLGWLEADRGGLRASQALLCMVGGKTAAFGIGVFMQDREVRNYGIRGKGYRFRDNHILKNVKAIHILAAIAWGGGAFAMQALHIMRAFASPPESASFIMACSRFIDTWVVMPGLFGCIATGLFYSIFTAIGFFRFLWIIYKWVVTVSACFWGLIFWSSLGDGLIAWLRPWNLDGPLLFMRSLILPDSLGAICLQTAVILSMCLISVYRPLGWWHKMCLLDAAPPDIDERGGK